MSTGSFNEGFCAFLESHLEKTFANSDRKEIKGLWCDGILPPVVESQLTKKAVNDTRQIITQAFVGHADTTAYKLIIDFGKYSLRRYAKGSSLLDCVPSEGSMDWVEIDFASRTLRIQLK
ncbi:hypothetical protein [Hymenobacter metallicola]|uniref:Uncharacterized protein n=1 Tax=Hymenobacter metallicola TaxID=2563114 RepID=A0A4Z0QI80_9BACT|nr:hypothetical protein [Hymenobacter metallicola]TGE28953.1 hypothetical protein E5K02_05685 [Hymenobacter metallicola]